MKKYKKALARDTIIYGIGKVSISAISFIMLPLYTRYLGAEGYGLLSLFLTFSGFLIVFFRWGLPSSYTVFYFDREDSLFRRELYSTCFWGIFLLNLPLLALLYFLRGPISGFVVGDPSKASLMIIVAVTTLVSAFLHMPYSLLQAEQRTKTYVFFRFLHASVTVAGNIAAIFIFKSGYEGILVANLAVNIIFIVIWLNYFLPVLRTKADTALLKSLLKFSLPMVVVALSQWILTMTDRIFLIHYTSAYDVGLYSFGYKVGTIVNLGIIGPFAVAWTPIMMKIAKEENGSSIFRETLVIWTAILIAASSAIALFSKEIALVMGGREFVSTARIIIMILWGEMFFGLYNFFIYGPSVEKRSNPLALQTFGAALINMLLNFVLIPKLGTIGAAISSLVSYFTMFLLLSFSVLKKKQISLKPFHYILTVSVCAGFGLLWLVSYELNIFIRALILIGIFSGFAGYYLRKRVR